MIMDQLVTFAGTNGAGGASGQLVTATGTTNSTNVYDTAPLSGNQVPDIGAGEQVAVVVDILQTLTSGGAATVQFKLVEADDAALTTNVQTLSASENFGFATLVAGAQVVLPWKRSSPLPPRRYVGVQIIIGTAALTNSTGQFYAALVKDIQDIANRYYKSGFSVG